MTPVTAMQFTMLSIHPGVTISVTETVAPAITQHAHIGMLAVSLIPVGSGRVTAPKNTTRMRDTITVAANTPKVPSTDFPLIM